MVGAKGGRGGQNVDNISMVPLPNGFAELPPPSKPHGEQNNEANANKHNQPQKHMGRAGGRGGGDHDPQGGGQDPSPGP